MGHDILLAPFGFFSSQTPVPTAISERWVIIDFKAEFEWAILKIKAKMTLLQFFGHIFLSYGPI